MKIEIEMTDEPLNIAPLRLPLSGESGAVVEFWGLVRSMEGGQKIAALHYEAYITMAKRLLYEIAQELLKKYPCQRLEVCHRIGPVAVGEPSVFLRIYSMHRSEAFQLAQEFMNRLKSDVPIWKRPLLAEKEKPSK
ncbi:molybdopterin converting factor [Methylacidiphilum kamchatkense Kam1]|uniref:Molybdopterin synthase catalytic subunit n=1 Tax=Methylacidiphilum kamchatkense Kam1 TaxID=1202785 RepID=A0A0C1V598_9BACT|nr:molybdenum cofactor biosynthesis protein MoaE [Methylacidiphilum kamchatkense]KIE58895.1 molybdopterin converting factor [Methylacidiphilum kamchatkense Kam1]QDQ41676.1 molybdopterin synthase subunit MoaE [Methylacidiphilum kamchatkense Kam1]